MNISNSNYQVSIHPPKDQSAEYFRSLDLEYKQLYEWQEDVINRALKKGGKRGRDYIIRFLSIQAPCGCGKTTVLIALAIYDIITSNWTQKQLEIVPQEHIGRGFSEEEKLEYINIQLEEKEYQWQVLEKHNFCLPKKNWNEIKTKGLKQWLLTPASKLAKGCPEGVISGLNAICCYQSLTIVWNQLTEEEKRKAIRNLSLGVDEAHHLKYVCYIDRDFKTEEEKRIALEEATEIGKICTYIMNSNIRSSKIRTTSATMYRGDRQFIFSDSVKKKFVNYNYSWADHFNTLGITNFRFSYEEYKKDPIDQIVANILKEPKEYHFVVIPSNGHKWRKSHAEELRLIISKLVDGGMARENINDLVTKRTQSNNKEDLLSEPKKFDPNNPPKFKVVIVCQLGREGTDWCPCTRLHNGAHERTLTLAMQTIGRLFRRYKWKNKIIATTYVKEFTPIRKITNRELLSDRTNAILLCMQLNDSFMPIIFPVIPPGEKKSCKKRIKVNLEEYLGDKYQDIKEEMIGRYDGIEDKTEDSIKTMLSELLEKHNVTENIDSVINALFTQVVRTAVDHNRASAPEFDGITINFLRKKGGFDKIKKHLRKSIYFGNYNKKDFPIIKEIVEKYLGVLKYKSYEEACDYVQNTLGFKSMSEYWDFALKQPIVNASKYEVQKEEV